MSTVHRDVMNTHTLVSGVRNEVEDTRTVVSDGHSKALKRFEDVCGQDRKVGTMCTLPVAD
jgi:hypothetical protein